MSGEPLPASKLRPWAGLVGSLLAISLVVLLGYLTFLFWVTRFTPAAGTLTLVVFSVVAGVATFFNPCSFPLLPGYLAHQVKVTPEEERGGFGALLYGGSVAALGVTTFNLILGGILAVLGVAFLGSLTLASAEPSLGVRIFRGVVGVLLIVLGLSHVTGRGLTFGFLEGLGHRIRSTQKTSATRQLYAYGLGYNAAGIGCGGPILAGLAVFAFAFGGFGATLIAFLVFTITMVPLMIGISVLPAIVGGKSLRGISRSTGKIQRIAGSAQTLVGAFVLFSAFFTAIFVQAFFP